MTFLPDNHGKPWPKPGSIGHAVLVLRAGFIVTEDDPRWSKKVIDALEDRYNRDDHFGRLGHYTPGMMGWRYPPHNRVDGERWFMGSEERDGQWTLWSFNHHYAPKRERRRAA